MFECEELEFDFLVGNGGFDIVVGFSFLVIGFFFLI